MKTSSLENKESKNKYPLGARIRDGLSSVFTKDNIKDVLKVGVVGGVMLFANELEAKDNPTSLNNSLNSSKPSSLNLSNPPSLNPSKPSSLNLSNPVGVNNMTFEEYNKSSNYNNGVESLESVTDTIDTYLFFNEWRKQVISLDTLTAPINVSVINVEGNLHFITDEDYNNGLDNPVLQWTENTNFTKFWINVLPDNTEGMKQVVLRFTDANGTILEITLDIELIKNSNPYPALESGVPLKGTLSTRQGYEGWVEYKCIPAEWVIRFGKQEIFVLSSFIRGTDIENMAFGKIGGGNTIYIKYKPNATDKLAVLVSNNQEDPSRTHLCTVPTLIELQDSLLATTLNLNLGRVPIGNTVITSFNTGTEPDVTLKKVITGEVLDSKHIPYVDLIQDEILIKPEYAQGDSHYVPLTYTVDNGHSQIVFTIDAYDPTTVGVEDELGDVPTEFKLEQNYPNPFNPETNIKFNLPEACHVDATVINILGQEVSRVINNDLPAGQASLQMDFSKFNASSGIYIFVIHAKGISGKDYHETIKMNLVK